MTFTMLLSVLMVTMESARIQAMKAKTEGVSHMALESVSGYFSLPLYEQYGLFAIPVTDSHVNVLLNESLTQNLSLASGISKKYYDLFQVSAYTATPCKIYHITDQNGEIFTNQILRYMQYAAPSAALDFLSTSSYVDAVKKREVDLSTVNTGDDSDTVDTSYELSQFTNDSSGDYEWEEEDASATKDSLLTKIQELISQSSLTIYTDNTSKISTQTVDLSAVPSHTCSYSTTSTVLNSYSDKQLYLLYLLNYFPSYTSSSDSKHALDYQLEYILCGKSSDDDNLLASILKLQTLRTQLNLAYLYTDTEKRTEAHALAVSATAMIPVPFIAEFTQLSILSAWAYAEGIADIRTLLKGEKIPIFKSKATWTLELSNLLVLDQSSRAKSAPSGLNYSQYLFLLLYPEINATTIYRTMDLIQLDIEKTADKSFKMAQCITGMQYKFQCDFHPVFAIPDYFYTKNSLFTHSFTQSYGY
jgi:hypothetical protein